jgi:hypothetical protein
MSRAHFTESSILLPKLGHYRIGCHIDFPAQSVAARDVAGMSRAAILGAAMLAATLGRPISANATLHAVWLYAVCSRGAAVPDSLPIPEQVFKALPPSAVADHNFCLNYFRAVVETHNLVRERPLFCLPRQVVLPDVIRLYLRERSGYKRANDSLSAEDMEKEPPIAATEDVLNYLRVAYPCT